MFLVNEANSYFLALVICFCCFSPHLFPEAEASVTVGINAIGCSCKDLIPSSATRHTCLMCSMDCSGNEIGGDIVVTRIGSFSTGRIRVELLAGSSNLLSNYSLDHEEFSFPTVAYVSQRTSFRFRLRGDLKERDSLPFFLPIRIIEDQKKVTYAYLQINGTCSGIAETAEYQTSNLVSATEVPGSDDGSTKGGVGFPVSDIPTEEPPLNDGDLSLPLTPSPSVSPPAPPLEIDRGSDLPDEDEGLYPSPTQRDSEESKFSLPASSTTSASFDLVSYIPSANDFDIRSVMTKTSIAYCLEISVVFSYVLYQAILFLNMRRELRRTGSVLNKG